MMLYFCMYDDDDDAGLSWQRGTAAFAASVMMLPRAPMQCIACV
jgi:hypothetical protein